MRRRRRRTSSRWRARGTSTACRSTGSCPNFVVQDGDPRGDGSGGPGYTIRDELNDRPYLRGTVGMALSGPDTGGSQFFITHSPQPHLDAKYTVFGQVVNGMDVVDRIQQLDVIQRCGSGMGELKRSSAASGSVRTSKRGRQPPPFLAGRAVTASCRPSSSRPSQLSSPCAYPPLRVGFVREEHLTVSQRRCHLARRRCACRRSYASLLTLPRDADRRRSCAAHAKKIGGANCLDTPRTGSGG